MKQSSHSPYQTYLIKDSFGKVGCFYYIKMPKEPLNYITYAHSMLYSVKVENEHYFCTFELYHHLVKGEPNSTFSQKLLLGTQQNCVLMELVLTIVYLVIMRENLRGWPYGILRTF